MALDSVQDFLHTFPGQTYLSLSFGDEQSPLGSGLIITRELRPPLWTLAGHSRRLKPNTLAAWQARLESLDNGKTQFWGYDRNRYYPILYPHGAWPTGGSFSGTTSRILTVNANNKAVALDSLPVGYRGSVGDLLSWTYNSTQYAMHRVVEAFLANGSGVTPEFEVRPHIRPTASATTAVSVKRPACQMKIVPGSVSTEIDDIGWGTISFQAQQTL